MTAAPKPRMRLVDGKAVPVGPQTYADKLARAKAYLQRRGIYVLDKGARRPKWGIPGEIPQEQNPLLVKVMDMDKRKA